MLLIALILSGLVNVFLLWVQIAQIFHVYIITHTPRWADLSGWLGTFALVVIILSATSDKPINRHNRLIKLLGITVVCLAIVQFLANRVYITFETHRFY